MPQTSPLAYRTGPCRHSRLGSLAAVVTLVLCALAGQARAAQYSGDRRSFSQPDGTRVEVRLYGTEFYMRAVTPDGFTVLRDPATGFIVYAAPGTDGSLRSTGIAYRGPATADTLRALAAQGVVVGLRPGSANVADVVERTRRSFMQGYDSTGTGSEFPVSLATSYSGGKYKTTLGSGKGLVVLVDFSDRPQSIPASEYDEAFNGDTYDSLGSVRTWIESISYAKYTASHTVIGPMRADYPTTHYEGSVEFDYSASRELMKQVFAYIDAQIDLTAYATNGAMPSLVVIYPGAEIAKVWATGLWPHAGEGGYTTSEKVRIPNAFISNGGTRTPMSLQTFRHELGHSLFSWPDTYDYDDDSMSAGGYATETTLPCAPFRMWSGWLNVTDLVGLNQNLSLAPNSDTCLRYLNAGNAKEYFVVEYMRKESVKRPDTPDEGLLIWHVDETGDNSLQDMTPTKHYELSVEQADGLFDLEKNKTSRANDLYHAGNKTTFDDTTTPNSKWWNGSASGFAVCDVGPLDAVMTLTVGCNGPIDTGGAGGGGGMGGAGGAAGTGGAGGTGGAADAGSDALGRDGASDGRDAITASDTLDATRDGPLATGGVQGSGGAGGASGSGGAPGGAGAGGASSVGGAGGAGGAIGTGGSRGTGGVTGSGGVAAAGGAGSGGLATAGGGGTQSAGGTSGGGGSFANGGTSGAGGFATGGSSTTPATASSGARTGCSCSLGSGRAGAGLALPLLLAVATVFVGLRRRR
jgi:M6 family metalloprotease-like protein